MISNACDSFFSEYRLKKYRLKNTSNYYYHAVSISAENDIIYQTDPLRLLLKQLHKNTVHLFQYTTVNKQTLYISKTLFYRKLLSTIAPKQNILISQKWYSSDTNTLFCLTKYLVHPHSPSHVFCVYFSTKHSKNNNNRLLSRRPIPLRDTSGPSNVPNCVFYNLYLGQ